MVQRGYLIERYNNMSGSYTCYRLVEEAKRLGMDLELIGVQDTIVKCGALYNNGKRLNNCDFVINRYKYGKIKEQINHLALKIYNSSQQFDIYVNKFEQVSSLKSDAFIVPNYILGMPSMSFEYISSVLGTPFVAKGLESSMGREVFLISTSSDLEALSHQYGKWKEWLFEEFIQTSFGKDLRIFSIRGNAIAAMERKSSSDFRANVALGAEVTPVPIDPTISKIADDIYKQTNLDFVGIDLLYGDNKYYFCEINVMPGIQGIETASGINISREMMLTIKKDFSDGEG